MIATLRRALGATLLLLAAAGSAQAAWWNSDWQYRTKIDIDLSAKGANIGEAIGRTQILVRLHEGNFKFDTAKQDGTDLRFVAGDDKTPLKYHIEKWDPLVDQVALIWVDVPQLAPGGVSNVTMYWGNDKATDAQDPAGTYDGDQLLIWHFGDPGPAKDVTAFKNDAATAAKRDDAGIIGYGVRLDGTTPIRSTGAASLNLAAGETYTWQVWAKPAPANQTSILFDQRDQGGVADFRVGLAAGVPYVSATPAAGASVTAQATTALTDAWHLITVTATDKITLYVDGVQVAQAAGSLPAIAGPGLLGGAAPVAAAATAPTAAGVPPLAAQAVPAAEPGFVGELDELEISKTVRPLGNIQVATHGQGPQANLLSFENPEQTSSFGSGYIGIILRSVTVDAWVIIGVLMLMLAVSWLVMASKAIQIGRTAGANKRFRALLPALSIGRGSTLIPPVPAAKLPGVRASSLFHIYDIGRREVEERLSGGNLQADGTIGPRSLEAIRSSMDAQLTRETARLSNLMVLLTIAISGGPFVGLLGTVVGVMITFAAVAAAGDVNVNSIAPGISAALLATACGMFVAIPALFGYNYLQTRIKTITTEMVVFVDELVTRVAEGSAMASRTRAAAAE